MIPNKRILYVAVILRRTFSQVLAWLVFVSIFFANWAYAITPGVQQLVHFETAGNSATERSPDLLILPHVEIPLEMVDFDFAKRLDPNIANALIIEKDGRRYVRWILNPEDRRWGKRLIAHFAAKGVELAINYYFIGHRTASRSYIAEDPATHTQFSVKSSTDVAGGVWRDKKQTVGEAMDARLVSDFLVEQNKKNAFKNFAIMDEPAILKIGDLDQAVVIRDLGILKNPNNKKLYVPGFAVLHNVVGHEIALKNGSNNPEEFWTKHYVEAVGRALGELAARTGLQFDSPHSQNFLVELDENYRPTGKIIFRDMSDLTIDVTIANALLGKNNRLVTEFTQKNNLHRSIEAGFGPLHGNTAPSWLSKSHYDTWKNVFFDAFEKSFSVISGHAIDVLKTERITERAYFRANYNLNDPQLKTFYSDLMKKSDVHKTEKSCHSLFMLN